MSSGTETLVASAADHAGLSQDIAAACDRIPPLWDLPNYVAVNPFLGFSAQPLPVAVRTVEDGLGAQVLPSFDYYRGLLADGRLSLAELSKAARRAGADIDALRAVLSDSDATAGLRVSRPPLTFAERFDLANSTDWQGQLLRSICRWCAVYASQGGAQWRHESRGLFASWREAEQVDRSLEIAGLHGWRAFVAKLSPQPLDAIAAMLERLGVPQGERLEYFYRLLAAVFGWASSFRRSVWQSSETGDVAELLAVCLCADTAIVELAARGHVPTLTPARQVEDESLRLVLQDAVEDGYARQLLDAIQPATAQAAARPAVQAVFCIDVRSEPLRRHLEAQSPAIETRGFAGFFGVTLNWQTDGTGSARCPVLLQPGVSVPAVASGRPALLAAAKDLQYAPASAFSFVELLGLGYGLKMAADSLAPGGATGDAEGAVAFNLSPNAAGGGIALDTRVDMAAGILKNMGFATSFGRLVLLCGHAGRSANNPHAAGLDCGACGGHGGAINARVAAAILNEPAVRAGLAARSVHVPADTHFLPAVHDTSTDAVELLDVDRLPESHRDDLATLRTWLEAAGAGVRQERSPSLGLGTAAPGLLARMLQRRARDWSEVRPEWALARNAAFIAARRVRTRGADLAGRTFLHEYDAELDADGSVLTLILTAPMVVASWINLQYFASTVDNDAFGCGDKALHNRVGSIGVVLGNGGDLRTGLAKQSVYAADGSWYHEPLRLQVVVEAPQEKIDAVLAAQKSVRDLVDNGWVRLFALDRDGVATHRRLSNGGWETFGF